MVSTQNYFSSGTNVTPILQSRKLSIGSHLESGDRHHLLGQAISSCYSLDQRVARNQMAVTARDSSLPGPEASNVTHDLYTVYMTKTGTDS